VGLIAWPLLGLKHVVGKGVLFGHLEIRRDIFRLHILELKMRRRLLTVPPLAGITKLLDLVCAIHTPAVIHVEEVGMAVAHVVVVRQWDRRQGNDLVLGIDPVILNVCASLDQNRILKQVVGGAILLEDDHDMLNHLRTRKSCIGPELPFRRSRPRLGNRAQANVLGGNESAQAKRQEQQAPPRAYGSPCQKAAQG